MPMNNYSLPLEQPVYQERPQQYRSNSMADAMNYSQFKGNSMRPANSGPPGLQKISIQGGNVMMERRISGPNIGMQQNNMQNLNGEFSKMSLNSNKMNSKMSTHKVIGTTGEKSIHSNSTIKEEEFDSERDGQEKDSNSSNNQVPQPHETSQYVFGNANSSNSLIDQEMIRNQRRRESQQIPLHSLEDKKLIKSPMKSSSVAFVPKSKDSRTSSMPNIFHPFGSKDKFSQPDNRGYYQQYGPHGGHPAMMTYAQPCIGSTPVQSNSQFIHQNPQNIHTMNNLEPPPQDYNYEERRHSGTTGGSSNQGKHMKIQQNKYKQMKKENSSQYHNKSRRTSGANITIPTNDKNIMDYKGEIPAFAKNQQGSKYLQRVLAKASPDILEFIVIEVGDYLQDLMVDSYGNYFCQKLLQSCSSKQRLYLLKKISPHIINISCDKRGTHSMQSMIQLINMEEEEQTLEDALSQHVISLCFDPNGTHVLQKVISTVKVNKLDYIFNSCFDKIVELSLDSNGLCVIKKIISKFSDFPEKRRLLIEKISENCVQLVQSPYGNYAVQEAIKYWNNDELNTIYMNLLGNVLQLSMQKFSSNVIEKCLDKADNEILLQYVETLSEPETMKSLAKSNYGFYVVQKLKNCCSHLDGVADKIQI